MKKYTETHEKIIYFHQILAHLALLRTTINNLTQSPLSTVSVVVRLAFVRFNSVALRF
jgi:hypothetical protein